MSHLTANLPISDATHTELAALSERSGVTATELSAGVPATASLLGPVWRR